MTTFTTQDRVSAEQKPTNGRELADELEKAPLLWFKDDTVGVWILAMLRSQHDEIEALRQQIRYLESKVYGGTTK